MSSMLLTLFSELPDPRRDQGKMYPLAPILLFTVLSMLAGARSYRQVHTFIRTQFAAVELAASSSPGLPTVPPPKPPTPASPPSVHQAGLIEIQLPGGVLLRVDAYVSGVSNKIEQLTPRDRRLGDRPAVAEVAPDFAQRDARELLASPVARWR